MTPEALLAHPELQYLRAEAASKPRRRIAKAGAAAQASHAEVRHEKLENEKRLASNRHSGSH
jgi:hypothetical protein